MYDRIKQLAEDSQDNRAETMDLRQAFKPGLLNAVTVSTREQALTRGMETVQRILEALNTLGVYISESEPAHGVGHVSRDYVNALRLLSRLDVTPAETFIGLVAGSLHDIGCAMVYRYDDDKRLVRHAEVGALMLGFLFELDSFGFNKAEQLLVRYGVAAHTHYLTAKEVKDAQGAGVGKIEPYDDMVDGKPFYPAWLPRWVDRLDTNGPAYVGRHYLTLIQAHKDFDGKDFFDVDYASAMRPLLRTKEERGKDPQTMAEHLLMYAESQTNGSPYGKHDFGAMVELRDAYKARIQRVIRATQSAVAGDDGLTQADILQCWTRHLARNNELSKNGADAAEQLRKMFATLPDASRLPWLNAFRVCLDEYREWSDEAIKFLETLPVQYRQLPGVCDNLQSMLQAIG